MVLNLSQQTDSADFLGGFRPMEPREALLPLLNTFQVCARMTVGSAHLIVVYVPCINAHPAWYL